MAAIDRLVMVGVLALGLLVGGAVAPGCGGQGSDEAGSWKKKPPKKKAKPRQSRPQYVMLDGQRTRVNWSDGDSFRVLTGPNKELRARLAGYNTLESYGPVHFWGGAHGYKLYDTAKQAQTRAKSEEWECKQLHSSGGYGRGLVLCPELVKAMLREGLAHIFYIGDDAPPEEHVALQLQAQRERLGIWERGIPEWIVTSIHSQDERPDKPHTYNRVCSTQTGIAEVVDHKSNFGTCDTYCFGGSCMLYAPFDVRYGKDRPDCLRNRPPNEMTAPMHLGYPLRRRGDRPAEAQPDAVRTVTPVTMPEVPEPLTETIILDGRKTLVHWSDGDSFSVLDGPHKDAKTRLAAFNTLESYGPVHFWSGFDADELYAIAKEATAVARSGEWTCALQPGSGGYGRLLIYCPDLVKTMLGAGLAHVMHVGKGKPDPALIEIQLQAQERRRGMWAKGIPSRIITSVHSMGEEDGNPQSEGYNRVCDTATGRSWVKRHSTRFESCDAWCHGGSCMLYLPYAERYGDGDKPTCLHLGQGHRMVAAPHLPEPLAGQLLSAHR